jgi:putative FmdB family regulatory protein
MPIYEYAASGKGCPHCEAHFDVLQKLADATLTQCPRCGAAVVRVIGVASVAMGNTHVLKESNVAKKGFTQYRRAGDGVYEKTAGKGPKYISGD